MRSGLRPARRCEGEKKANADKHLLARMWAGYTRGIEFICACPPNENTLSISTAQTVVVIDNTRGCCHHGQHEGYTADSDTNHLRGECLR